MRKGTFRSANVASRAILHFTRQIRGSQHLQRAVSAPGLDEMVAHLLTSRRECNRRMDLEVLLSEILDRCEDIPNNLQALHLASLYWGSEGHYRGCTHLGWGY